MISENNRGFMMQKVRVFFFVFLVIFIDSEVNARNTKMPAYEEYLNQIFQTYTKQMKDELNLVYSGKGITLHDKVEEIRMKFRANRRATLEEARTLQLLAMNKLVQVINNHKGIQLYLAEL